MKHVNTGVRIGLERAKTDFFEYKGKMYPAGTVFKMKHPKKDYLSDVTAIFHGSLNDLYPDKWCIGFNTDFDRASGYEYANGLKWKTLMPIEKDKLADMIVEIYPGNNYTKLESNRKYVSDLNDWNLIAKWGMYIFAMGITSIFHGRIFGWILWTVIFFVWRHNYREENCVYYE